MLPKKERITKETFLSIMKNGKILSSPLFIFRYLTINNKEYSPKYAFVAPKTVAKQAVLRNKLRRQGYNALKQYKQLPCVMGIFFYKKGSGKASFKEIKDSTKTILSKIS
ncbi:MAG: ribonuclease P protein component [Patescibacteria group bacterium]|nr:ribonuclease P protein component [Patescibacteria group bacterium]